MKPTEKDFQTAREYLQGIASQIVTFNDNIFLKIGEASYRQKELSEILCNYTLHLEKLGKIKFTEGRDAGLIKFTDGRAEE